jgi:hypothetical protein
MKHFAIEDWADEARDLVGGSQKSAMMRHLDEGCERCAGTFRMWQGVSQIASREKSYIPPEGIVRSVKALYALQKPESLAARSVKVARLVFDSFKQPVPIGVRASGQPIRQVLYRTNGYYIDLRIEGQTGSSQSSVVGQILRHPGAPPANAHLPVVVSRGKTPMVRTITNQLGEFHFEFDATKNHELSILVDEDASISVPLRGSQRS